MGGKRDEILKVAEEVFAEKNFKGATMREIAEKVNIKKPALYYHFRNKEDIYNSMIIEIYGQLQDKVLDPVKRGRSLEEKIRLFISHLVDFWAQHPAFPRIIAQEVISGSDLVYSELEPKFWMPMYQEIMAEIEKEGLKEPEVNYVDPQMLAINIFGMTIFYFFAGPIFTAISGEDSFSSKNIEKLKEEITSVVFNGMRKPGSRKRR